MTNPTSSPNSACSSSSNNPLAITLANPKKHINDSDDEKDFLNTLPSEIFAHIVSFLEMRDILVLSECSNKIWTVLKSNYIKPLKEETRKRIMTVASTPLEASIEAHRLSNIPTEPIKSSFIFKQLIERDVEHLSNIRKRNAKKRDRTHDEEQAKSYHSTLIHYSHKLHSVISYYQKV